MQSDRDIISNSASTTTSSDFTSTSTAKIYNWSNDNCASEDFFKTSDEFEQFLIQNCSSLTGIINVAKLSQSYNHKISPSYAIYTPYEFLYKKSKETNLNLYKHDINKNKLSTAGYIKLLIGHTGLFCIFLYLINHNNRGINNFEKQVKFFNDTLDLISKFSIKNDGTNVGLLIAKNLKLFPVKDKDSLPEFYDLMFAFSQLPTKQIIHNYALFIHYINKNLEFLTLRRFSYISNLNENNKNDRIIVQAENGDDIVLSISKDTTQSLELTPGCRISTCKGLGFFLGVEAESQHIWLLLDKNSGATRWNDIKTKEDLQKSLIFKFKDLEKPTASKLVQLTIDVVTNNLISDIRIRFVRQSQIHFETVDISEARLNIYNLSFLDGIATKFGNGIVIGISNCKLWIYLPHNDQENNFYSIETKEIEKLKINKRKTLTGEELIKHDENLISANVFNILLSEIENKIKSKQPPFQNEETSFFQNILNIFTEIHFYLDDKLKKLGENNNIFQKKLAIFDAMLTFFADCQTKNTSNSLELLQHNLALIEIPQGFVSKEFYKILNSISCYSEQELMNQYKRYICLLQQADNFDKFKKHKDIKDLNISHLIFRTNKDTLGEIDVSETMLSQFGVKFYQQFKYKDISNDKDTLCTIIGVYNTKLCYYTETDRCFTINHITSEHSVKFEIDDIMSNSNLRRFNEVLLKNNLPKPKHTIEFYTDAEDFPKRSRLNIPFKMFNKKEKKTKSDDVVTRVDQLYQL